METNLKETKTDSWHSLSDIIDDLIDDVRRQMDLIEFGPMTTVTVEELEDIKNRRLQGVHGTEDGALIAAMIDELHDLYEVLLGEHAEEHKAKHGIRLFRGPSRGPAKNS